MPPGPDTPAYRQRSWREPIPPRVRSGNLSPDAAAALLGTTASLSIRIYTIENPLAAFTSGDTRDQVQNEYRPIQRWISSFWVTHMNFIEMSRFHPGIC